MTESCDAELFHYQRLFGVTGDGLQMKVTIITDEKGRIHSSSIQMRAVEGPVALDAHPSLWSKPFTLKPNIIGENEFGDAS